MIGLSDQTFFFHWLSLDWNLFVKKTILQVYLTDQVLLLLMFIFLFIIFYLWFSFVFIIKAFTEPSHGSDNHHHHGDNHGHSHGADETAEMAKIEHGDHTRSVIYGLMSLMGIIGFLTFERVLTIISDLFSQSNRKSSKVIFI